MCFKTFTVLLILTTVVLPFYIKINALFDRDGPLRSTRCDFEFKISCPPQHSARLYTCWPFSSSLDFHLLRRV